MDIIVHLHDAEVSEYMRKQARQAVERAAKRIPRVVETVITFEQDGRTRRVTVVMRAPKHHEVIGRGEGRYFGPALRQAILRVQAQASRERSHIGHHRARERNRVAYARG